MPEGDVVWRAGRHLDRALAGQLVTSSDFRLPALATADVSGRRVVEVVSRGKHLLTRFEGGLSLHTHFRMDGSWHLYPTGERWTGGPAHEIRLVLTTEPTTAVGYRLHDVALVPTADEDSLVGHLGPDLLSPGFGPDDEADALRRLLAQPERTIGEALLDQRNLAGIGTVYRAETLFLSGVDPWTPVGEVPDLRGVVRRARRLLDANRDRVPQVTTGDRRRGHELWVYGRAGRPCRRCGTPLRRADMGDPTYERLVVWCAACQRRPAG